MSVYSDGEASYIVRTKDVNVVAEMLRLGWRQHKEIDAEYGVFDVDDYPADPLTEDEPDFEAFVQAAKKLGEDGTYYLGGQYYNKLNATYTFSEYLEFLSPELEAGADFTVELNLVNYSEIEGGGFIQHVVMHWEKSGQNFTRKKISDEEFPYNEQYCDQFDIEFYGDEEEDEDD